MAACKITSVREQIIRGIIGVVLLGVAVYFLRTNAVVAFFFVLLSLIPMRGCPTCWSFGMYEALKHARAKKAENAEKPEISPKSPAVAGD
jgi:hypothetical protein